MKSELHSATYFITYILRIKRCPISENKLNKLRLHLNDVLYRKYRDHWFVDKPNKGEGYRCIRCNEHYTDPMIIEAGDRSGISGDIIKEYLPPELTLWINPGEVYYRIGSHGTLNLLYTGENQTVWMPATENGSSKNYLSLFFTTFKSIRDFFKNIVN